VAPRSDHLLRLTAIAAVVLLGAVAGCTDDGDVRAAPTTSATEAPSTRPSTTATTAGPTTTHPEVLTTAPTLPPKPAVCEPEMGTTMLSSYWYPPYPKFPEPPPGWAPADTFDWDGDGTPDSLTVAGHEVVVDWGAGQVVVEGVVTDFFAEPGIDDDGDVYTIYTQEVAAQHVPAAVGDVTGDGRSDLVVFAGGHTAVLVGQGAATPPGRVAFDDVGRSTLGWRSPPQRVPQHYTPEGEPWNERPLNPNPVGDVAVLWDADGDGASEFSVTRWHERTGPSVVHFAGVPCSLPS
jgi:hypothetical protein